MLIVVRVHFLSVLLLQVSHGEHVRATHSQRRVANWRRERGFCNLKPKCGRCGVSEEVCPAPHVPQGWSTQAVGRSGLQASASWGREARLSAGSQRGWESLSRRPCLLFALGMVCGKRDHMNENSLFALKGALGNAVATVTQGSWGEDPRACGAGL